MPTEDGRQLTLPVLFGLAILSALEAPLRKRFSLRSSYGKTFYSGNLPITHEETPLRPPFRGERPLTPAVLKDLFFQV